MRIRLLAAAAGMACAFGGAALAQPSCISGTEEGTLQFRLIQTELMVAALSCRGAGYDQRYASFVNRYSSTLNVNGRQLQTYFRKYYGGGATSTMDRYVTAIANDASQRSMTQANFCLEVAKLFDRVMTTEHKDVPALLAAQPIKSIHQPQMCAGQTIPASVAGPAPAPPAPAKAAPTKAATPSAKPATAAKTTPAKPKASATAQR